MVCRARGRSCLPEDCGSAKRRPGAITVLGGGRQLQALCLPEWVFASVLSAVAASTAEEIIPVWAGGMRWEQK